MKNFGDFLRAHGNTLNALGGILRALLAEIPINAEHKANIDASIDSVVAHGDALIELATVAANAVTPHHDATVAPVSAPGSLDHFMTTANANLGELPATAPFTW